MPTLAGVHALLPEHRYPQDEITDTFARLCMPDERTQALTRRLHSSARVTTRHLALPIEDYEAIDTFTAANEAFAQRAVELGAEAVDNALRAAGLAPQDVDVIVSTTVTGVLVPSLEARIAPLVGLRPDVKRVPMFGLGCLAGAAGIARLYELLAGDPDAVGVLLSVELCSLTVQRNDPSAANMVASGLFGDGASAVVMLGDARARAPRRDGSQRSPGPRVVDTVSHLYPDTERAMGWDVGSAGLQIVLGAEVPELVHTYLADDVDGFLKRNGLEIADIARWICHPGGPKVIEAIQDELGLTEDDLAMTWRSLDRIGNLSSSSVLHVLADTLRDRPATEGDYGVIMAMGPGFCAELVLVQW